MKQFYGLMIMGILVGSLNAKPVHASKNVPASSIPFSDQSSSTQQQDQLTWFYEGIDDYLHDRKRDYHDERARQWYERGRQLAKDWQEEHPQVKEPTLNDIQPAQTEPTQVESVPQVIEATSPIPASSANDIIPSEDITTSSSSEVQESDDTEVYPRLKAPLSHEQAEFIKTLSRNAVPIGNRYDLYPSIMMAQAILESNWGQSKLARQSHNLFGVKGDFQGNSVMMPTNEHLDGANQVINGQFKHYPNVEAALIDYAMVMDQPIYQNVHRSHSKNYQSAIKSLTGVYATDPHYHQKLDQLIRSYHLDKYDPDHQSSTANRYPATMTTNGHEKASSSPSKTSWNWQWPMLGGMGSVGVIGLIRRFWF